MRGGTNPPLPTLHSRATHPAPDVARSGQADFDDLQVEDPARDLHLNLVTDLLAHQALSDGTGDQDLILIVVLLARSDEDEVFFLIELEVQDADFQAVGDPFRG